MLIQFQNYNYSFTAATKYPVIPKPELLECIKSGLTYKEITKKYNVPGQVVTRSFNWFGLKSPAQAEKERNTREVLNLYNQGYPVRKIPKKLALRSDVVKRIIKAYNEAQAKKGEDPLLNKILKKLNMSNDDVKKYLK